MSGMAKPSDEEIRMMSTLTCPRCGHASMDEMPVTSCRYFYECQGCGVTLKPRPGDCCVYCSYGDVKCPPVQMGGGCN